MKNSQYSVKDIGGWHFWAIGYGAWTTGNITDKMVEEYLEHHRKKGGSDDAIILDQKRIYS